MNIKPILFSTPMVTAIMEDRKVMTRRIVKFKSIFQNEYGNWNYEYKGHAASNQDKESMNDDFFGLKDYCPYGQVGDVLYVRETHYRWGKWVKDGKTKKGVQKWKFVPVKSILEPEILFENNRPSSFRKSRSKDAPELPFWHKRNSLFMPKSAARIWLEITDIRVERVQEITAEDARDEGIYREWDGTKHWYKNYSMIASMLVMPRESFMTLWMSINGVESWDVNPWVWVLSFKVLSKTGKPLNI